MSRLAGVGLIAEDAVGELRGGDPVEDVSQTVLGRSCLSAATAGVEGVSIDPPATREGMAWAQVDALRARAGTQPRT